MANGKENHRISINSSTNKSPWGSISNPADSQTSISLDRIMKEEQARGFEIANKLTDTLDSANQKMKYAEFSQSSSESSHLGPDCSRDYEIAYDLSQEPDCSFDQDLALKMQREFDRAIELSEQFAINRERIGVAKATISPNSYIMDRRSTDSDDDDESDDFREFATNLLYENLKINFPPSGYLNNNGKIITKHDQTLNERINSNKAMKFIELPTGDVINERLGAKVYNELRSFGNEETKRSIRLKDKDEKAMNDISIDMKSRLILLKWIDIGDFDRIEGIIATGKESAVLHGICDYKTGRSIPTMPATTSNSNSEHDDKDSGGVKNNKAGENDKGTDNEDTCTEAEDGSTHYAIKVYKPSLASFKNRREYVNDFRFKNPRGIMKIWAKKEFMNLKRLKRANIRCPIPIKQQQNLLLMSLIGGTKAAPRLKEIEFLDKEVMEEAFAQVRNIIYTMYNDCNLVHGDLSEFNLLMHDGLIYVIDLAQGMDISHPNALFFLCRDITNVMAFFDRIGCNGLPTCHQLFSDVTGIHLDPAKNLYAQVESFERENRNESIRDAKIHPANYELETYLSEKNCS